MDFLLYVTKNAIYKKEIGSGSFERTDVAVIGRVTLAAGRNRWIGGVGDRGVARGPIIQSGLSRAWWHDKLARLFGAMRSRVREVIELCGPLFKECVMTRGINVSNFVELLSTLATDTKARKKNTKATQRADLSGYH